MRSDTEILNDGMRVLIEHLGVVDAYRFIAIVKREQLDFAQWSENAKNITMECPNK